MTDKQPIAVIEGTEPRIYLIRGHKVMLDEDLAALYELDTDALNHVVTRNIECFPEDLMFQLNPDEFADLKSRFAISRRAVPFAFTGQGLALLSSVLHDEREIHENRGLCSPSCNCRR